MSNNFLRKAVFATFVMLIALAGTSWLGLWQYSVAYRDQLVEEISKLPQVQLTEVTQVGRFLSEPDYGRRVSVSGQLDCSRQLLVGESKPLWVVCPMVLADGSLAAVALGALPNSDWQAPALAEYEVKGRVQPSQDTSAPPAIYPRPASDVVDLLGTAELTGRWVNDVRDGFVVASANTSRAFGLAPIPLSTLAYPPDGIEVRNLFYAWQWWLFAAFTLFIWGRYLRDEWHLARAEQNQ